MCAGVARKAEASLAVDALKAGAYRHLLYKAMLDIRGLCQARGEASLNPLVWYRRYHSGRTAGMLADWLHNLAQKSSEDFLGFDEDMFWNEHDYFLRTQPHAGFERYRSLFDAHLEGRIKTSQPPYVG